jgi:hypothetical protein
MDDLRDDNQEKKDRRGEQDRLDDALSSAPFTGSAQYGEGGYYQDRARMHIQKDYSEDDPAGLDISDEDLHVQIQESLSRQVRLDISGIEVDVRQGTVTLRGYVDSQWAKETAEKATGKVDGVHTVHNLLELDDPRRVHGPNPP